MGDLRLLVVDDDGLVGWALEKAASTRCADVCIAGTGVDALAAIRAAPIDIAFIDIHLPDVNGLDLLTRIREMSPSTRLVVLTSDASASNRECAYERGAWQFIEKPFDLAEIAQVLDECTGPVDERRTDRREICRVPVRVDLLESSRAPGAFPSSSFEALAVDVSEHGLRLHAPCRLAPGQLVTLHPMDYTNPCSIFLCSDRPAQVVWVNPGPALATVGLSYLPR
jgi:DNA-binding response OmpR family regulator